MPMGRNVAGARIDNRPDVVNVKPMGTSAHDAAHVAPRALPEEAEANNSELGNQIENGILHDESNEKQDVLVVKSTNHELEERIIKAETPKSADKKLSSPAKPLMTSSDNISIEQVTPGSDNGDQNHDNGAENNGPRVRISPQFNDMLSHSSARKSQPSVSSMSRNPMLHNNKGYYDDDDNCSLASSTTSVRTRVTVPVAPRFTVDQRLERRKEFYTKLEEKHKALEKERRDFEARTKEEEQAAIKLLRKTMAYKANPVPNFYKEGPPPKVELKKLPVTRPKSPNLNRRKSCSDAIKSSPEVCARAPRHSVGSYREGKNSPITPKSKDQTGLRKSNGTVKSKERVQKPKETKGSPSVKVKVTNEIPRVKEQEIVTADISVTES